MYYLLYHCVVGNKQFLENFFQLGHVVLCGFVNMHARDTPIESRAESRAKGILHALVTCVRV